MTLENKIKEYCKEHYFRNKLQDESENPVLMSNSELLKFIHKYSINKEIDSIIKKENDFIKEINSKMLNSIDYKVITILDILYAKSKNSYIVGGAIRDCILGIEPKDFDFVTDIHYDDIKELFNSKDFKVIETGKEFLVLTVIYEDESFEIAMFRKDGAYSDGRRPDKTEIGTIYEDSSRRDFTINSLYWNYNVVLDLSGYGLDDARDKILRFIGNPIDRIKEDYLRGWRYLRFLKLGFKPDNKSYKAIKSEWNSIYTNSNPQRVINEIIKIINL